MVYDPATNEQIVETQAEFFRDISDTLLNFTAEEILDGKDDFNGSIEAWLQFKQESFAKVAEEAAKRAEEVYGYVPQAIRQTIELAYDIGETSGAAELLSAGIQPDLGAGFQTLAEYAIDALVDSAVTRVQNRMNKLQITRSVNDAYSQATEAAAALSLSGVPLEDAVERAVDDLLEQGIKEINVGNRKMGIDSYAETSIRTIAGNAQVQGSIDRYEDAGEYLVWITDSPMECKLCRKFEGKILRTTEDLEKIPKKFHSKKSLEYAKSKGLFHPNCTHSAQMYIEGYSTPPKDTNDAENEERRNKIRRLQKLERKNKNKEKFWRENGSPRRAALAKKRASQYREQRRRFESLIERKSLGWFTGEDRLRRLAAANGVPEALIEQAGGNLPALNKLAAKTGFDPRLTSAQVRKDVAAVRVAPNVKDYGFDNLNDLKKNNIEGYKDLQIRTQRYFEADVGQMNFLEDSNKFHQPPAIPKDAKKSKAAFNRIVGRKGKYKNEYGRWKWNDKKGKPEIVWSDLQTQEMLDEVDLFIQEEIAGGAQAEKKQILAGGLPSSGKTFNLKAQGYDADKYVTVNPDRFKVRIILNKYGTKIDKRINKNMSDVFINDPKFGAGSKLTSKHPVYLSLKSVHPDIADDIYLKTFDKSTLEEIREGLVAKTNIGDTGLYGLESANIIHEESSTMTKIAQDVASEDGLNIIHDVTLGSRKPINVIDNLVTNAGYEKPQIMFISYRKEEAVSSVIDRYLRGNFDNIESTGRGGRYVMTEVLDDATKRVDAGEGVSKTVDLLGRDAITDNEIFLAELLDNPNIAPDNVQDVRIINRYSLTDPDPRSNFKSVRLQVDKVNGKFVVRRQAGSDLDGLAAWIEDEDVRLIGNRAGVDDFDKILENQVLKSSQGNVTIGVKQSYLNKISERRRTFTLAGRRADDAGLYIIAQEKGFAGKPSKVDKPIDLVDGTTLNDPKFKDASVTANEELKNDLIVFRGLSDSLDTDQETWKLQNTKIPVGKRMKALSQTFTIQLADDTRIPKIETDIGITMYDAKQTANTISRYVNNLGVDFNTKYIDAEAMMEAQDIWRAIANTEGIEGVTKSYLQQTGKAQIDGYIDISLFSRPEFQDIYDDRLYNRGINIEKKNMPPLIMSGLEMHEEFIDGEYYGGHGIYGNGTYTDTDLTTASMYANQADAVDGYGEGGVVQAIKINKGTKMPSTETLQKVARQAEEAKLELYRRYNSGAYNADKARNYRELMTLVEVDIGRRLAALGYQAYDVSILDGIKSHIVILDRTAITVAEQPVAINGKIQP